MKRVAIRLASRKAMSGAESGAGGARAMSRRYAETGQTAGSAVAGRRTVLRSAARRIVLDHLVVMARLLGARRVSALMRCIVGSKAHTEGGTTELWRRNLTNMMSIARTRQRR